MRTENFQSCLICRVGIGNTLFAPVTKLSSHMHPFSVYFYNLRIAYGQPNASLLGTACLFDGGGGPFDY